MRILTLLGVVIAALSLVFYFVGVAGEAVLPLAIVAVVLVAIGAYTGR